MEQRGGVAANKNKVDKSKEVDANVSSENEWKNKS